MKKNLIALAIGAAVGLASLPASAGDVSGMTYVVAPMLHGVWVDRSRDVDDGMQYGLGMGRGINEKWSVEAAIFKSQLDAPQSDSFDMSGISIAGLRHFFPDSKASPFLSLGGGLLRTSAEGGNKADDPMVELGLGVMIDLFAKPDGSRKLLARPEVKSRWQLQSGSDDAHDLLAGISFIFAFGPPRAAPPPPPAAEPEPPAAEPPPTPPPPPPPADSDGDGVIDSVDQCPDTPKGDRVGPQGCSCDVTVRVNFASDSAVLSPEAKQQLDQTIANLKRLRFVAGVAEGHTDNTASDAYNQQLSERRAKAVAEYIQAGGVAAGRLLAVGKGESEPVADNATREGRAENRRVVLRRTDCDQPQ